MRIAADIDGVICNTAKPMKKVAYEMGLKLSFKQYVPTINGEIADQKIIHDIVHFVLGTKMDWIKPYKDALEFFPLIAKEIGAITFVTARNEMYADPTHEWIQNYFSFPYVLVHKDSAEKPQFVKEEGFDVFIEDRLNTANSAAEIGLNVYLIERQWNRYRETHKNVKKVKSVGEVYSDLCYTLGK